MVTFLTQISLFCILLSAAGGEDTWFTTEPKHYQLKAGTDIKLPCKLNGTAGAVISWSWNGRLITAGPTMVFDEDRLGVVEGGRELIIRKIDTTDSGEYTCTYNLKYSPITLTHRLDVLVVPTAKILGSNKHILTREGERMELRCQVTGFPLPTVSWHLKDRQEILTDRQTIIIDVLRYDNAGEYECRAVNSEGRARDVVFVDVQYKPRTKLTKKSAVSSGGSMDRRETFFSCSVEANPQAKVTWFKNNYEVYQQDTRKLQGLRNEGSDLKNHILKIKSLEETDYGNYSCVATNPLGSSTSSYHLTGSPDQPITLSPGHSRFSMSYTLVWKVWTPHTFPILNQSILYRMIGKATGRAVTEAEGTWHNLALITEKTHLFQDTYSMELSGLTGDCEYEVRIRAMNSQGWSPLSSSFIFRTSGIIYRPLPSVYTEGQLSSEAGWVSPGFTCLTFILQLVLVIFYQN